MKFFSFLILLMCCATLSFSQQEDNFSKTEQAIVDVIKQETEGWWHRDYEKWSDSWAHKPYVRWSGTTNLNHEEYDGWDTLSNYVKTTFEKYPDKDTDPVKRMDWEFRIYKNAAWVRYVQDAYGISKETRILEKIGGQWKLVYVGWINESSYKEASASK